MNVLSSFPDPRPTTNPYIVQLATALRQTDEVELTTFSWPVALTRRFDVFHAHWPEILIGGRNGPKKFVRQLLFVLLMWRFRAQRTAIVRTVHNEGLPPEISWVERALLDWLDRRTVHRITINTVTWLPSAQAHSLILHGHYRDWFAQLPKQNPVPGRFAFVGRIRSYKGVESLIHAFRMLPGQDLTLSIAGMPSGEDVVGELCLLADDDSRIDFRFAHVDDAELVRIVTSAELVVFPYHRMHNSGGVLAALSLDRPVLVPHNEVNQELAEEVGPGWVHTFDQDLQAADLEQALCRVRTGDEFRGACPNLDARGWNDTGAAHVTAYRSAIERVRRHGSPSHRGDPPDRVRP